jgi:signal transduction histidine kinase
VTVALAAFGWVLAVGAYGLALAARRELDTRMERLARAAHELRRPLTAARLAAHGLAGANGDRPARAAAIERELARAGRLLGDLDAVRGVAAPPWPGKPRTVFVGELLADVVASWEAVAAAQGRAVRVEPGAGAEVVVRGDPDRLGQALANLVANALEHGAGTVRVGASAPDEVSLDPSARAEVRSVASDATARPERVMLWVSDAGPGPGEALDDFVGRARAGRGARGRGLAIAAEIARAHGGALRVERDGTTRSSRLVLDLPATTLRLTPR